MTDLLKKLPAALRTEELKRVFGGTFDVAMSKKDSDYLAGYLGRRVPGKFNPITDFYAPEPDKNRTRWQLEPTSFSRDTLYNKTDILFYEDMLEKIEYYGGNTLNQDRLFESEYYTFAPPIDYDMFINYQNYYWVDQGLPVISVPNTLASDINGQHSFTTPSISSAPNLKLSTGMAISLPDDPNNIGTYIVEFMGDCEGIRLSKKYVGLTLGSKYQLLPWDAEITLSNGTVIKNSNWDTAPWDIIVASGSNDYITIQRGSKNQNAWSRTNRWIHIDTINAVCSSLGTSFPINAIRAQRPIIQFNADILLYKSGTNFVSDIKYGFKVDENNTAIIYNDFINKPVTTLNTKYGIDLQNGDLITFFNQGEIETRWDTFHWAGNMWDAPAGTLSNNIIFQVSVAFNGIVNVAPYIVVNDNDIVFVDQSVQYSAQAGESWYYKNGIWNLAYNNKTGPNQPPEFDLFDHNGIQLNDTGKYPESNFAGSKIFSYKVNQIPGVSVDPELGFPIVYTGTGQATDILFENNLITDRYIYGTPVADIDGYYYFKNIELHNSWELYKPNICPNIIVSSKDKVSASKQRVIDQFAVGYDSEFIFRLSVVPFGFIGVNGDIITNDTSDVIVTVNGTPVLNLDNQANGYVIKVINNLLYVDLTAYLTNLLLTPQPVAPVVRLATYTHGTLDPNSHGYFEIPQQLEANPNQQEIKEINGSDLIEHFSSIIENQLDFIGTGYGGSNNYRDSLKNNSAGSFILQNLSPALKSMLISTEGDLDFIPSLRFSQDEYTKFKNRYLKTAQQLINQSFNPTKDSVTDVAIAKWVDLILSTINISREFSRAFAYSYMVASGTPYSSESHTVAFGPVNPVILNNYVDLSDLKNSLYVYNGDVLLVIGQDYEILSNNSLIEITILQPSLDGLTLTFLLFKDPAPAYIPSTPAKMGLSEICIPQIVTDISFAIPTNVIIGHDGSKTVVFNDYRDNLLLELERRIYNLIQQKYRYEYKIPVELESVKSGYFRQTRYSYNEYLNITESYLNKWCAKNKANYFKNEWENSNGIVPVNSLWKLYNYRNALTSSGQRLNLPGNWKGIFMYCYDTLYPNTRPWEMLGFSNIPVWWISQYGNGSPNSSGEIAWNSTNTVMWADISAGIIRHGPRAIIDPITFIAQPQEMWARPTLNSIMPVDAGGNIISVMNIFNVLSTGNPYYPFDLFNEDWIYGDGSPVEQAWMSSSEYIFSQQEFLYLMKPSSYGELMWDTYGTEYSPENQYVQNDIYSYNDKLFKWMRPKNSDQYVHAENIDGDIQVRFGYQRWISDRILFLGKDISSTFGVKIRYLDVNLANKFAGFTNKDTVNTYIEGISPSAKINTLGIPSNNFDVILHKGPAINSYSYSGVIIRTLEDGTFAIYGYDLLNSQFNTIDRANSKLIDITIGGTPASFIYFIPNRQYSTGDIVRYNGIYYSSNGVQNPSTFVDSSWTKLKALPVVGGVSVTYKPDNGNTLTTYPYGSILKNAQEVTDFLTGWGAYLTSFGWDFTQVDSDTNIVNDWLASIKQFLFWLNSEWGPNTSIQLSPLANSASITVKKGYPNNVEMISNGVYNILDKYGIAIPPTSTIVKRDRQTITVEPIDLAAGGIYFMQVNSSETEHIIIFDNTTSFNDTIYSPLLRSRQSRIRFNGFRTNDWYGKMEAPGYFIIGNELTPNFDTIVDDMRYYYDPDVAIDNTSLEDLGRSLIGFDRKPYLDNLQISNDVQYLFYQGFIRQKGTVQSLNKLFRSSQAQTGDSMDVYEEWALRVGNFGNTVEQVSTEFILTPEQDTGEVILARLNYVPSTIGSIKQINIFNAEQIYKKIPTISIGLPDATPTTIWYNFLPGRTYYPGETVKVINTEGNVDFYTSEITQSQVIFNPLTWISVLKTRPARAHIILDTVGKISRIDITDSGYGYSGPAAVEIIASSDITNNQDKLYSVWQGDIVSDNTLDNVVNIDINDDSVWVRRPVEPINSLTFPLTDKIDYEIPNAGYVHFADIDWYSFSVNDTAINWGTPTFNPVKDDTVWIANTFTNDWSVYKLKEFDKSWKIISDNIGNLSLIIPKDIVLGDQLSDEDYRTDLGNMISLQINVDGNVSGDTNYAVCFSPSSTLYTDPGTLIDYNSYSLLTLIGTIITSENIPQFEQLNELLLFRSLRFLEIPSIGLPSYITPGDKVWIDDVSDKWVVYDITSINPIKLSIHRRQENLIDTSLFQKANVFQGQNGNTLTNLPVYDPFKEILPEQVTNNLSHITILDPARYNVTGNNRLFTNNPKFGPGQVGQLWWDLSTAKYVYYEMSKASESDIENLKYRRDNWGKLFPGSTIDIYEWTRSSSTPDLYTGTGIPRDTSSYVQITTSNAFTGNTSTDYYFWVKNSTSKPNLKNRTLTASEVSRLLTTPKGQGYSYYCPIQQTSSNNTYIFYNVQEILSFKGKNVQINYRHGKRNDQPHVQWELFREGDELSPVSNHYWDKFVDSLSGYTKILPIVDSFNYSIPVDSGEVLPVPDPNLSLYEKYGIAIRPRQSMFVDMIAARKIFYQSANKVLADIGGIPATWTGSPITDESTGVIQINKSVYTTINSYQMSVDIRNLLFKLRNEVLIDNNLIGQNLIFSSMLNYVLSEQRTPDWIFKTSYITIKENNIPLSKTSLYAPDQISNILEYIDDVKPYHTQIRNYTRVYTTLDNANGTVSDDLKFDITIDFGPNMEYNAIDGWDQSNWDINNWDNQKGYPASNFVTVDAKLLTDNIDQFMSQENVFVVDVNTQDLSKRGVSKLYPYTYNFSGINLNDPQTIITPTQVVGMLKNDKILIAGRDFYVESDNNGNFTSYLFNDPGNAMLKALVWLDGGPILTMNFPTYRNEYALGFPTSNAVITVDNRNPYNFDEVISFTINVEDETGSQIFHRNATAYSGILSNIIDAPIDDTDNIDHIIIYIDPTIHTGSVNILPDVDIDNPGVIWINNERIEYRNKIKIGNNTWELRLIRRATQGTSATYHALSSKIFVEEGNIMPSNSINIVWAGSDSPTPDLSTQFDTDKYTSISAVAPNGLWGGTSSPAVFLRDKPGEALN